MRAVRGMVGEKRIAPPMMEHMILLTFLCAQSEAIIDLLEHGLAALLEGRQHHTLEGFTVGSLHWPL